MRTLSIALLLLIIACVGGVARAEEAENRSLVIEYERESEQSADHERSGSHTIIISADRLAKSDREIPLSSAVVNETQIREKIYTGMVDLLESIPGFSRVYDYHSPIILRGTSGSKMLIMRDCSPVFSTFPGGFMGQSVNVYDVGRVEVVRGPGSVIYGSGATSGIINIIDRDVFEEEGVGVEGGVSCGTNANSRMGIGSVRAGNKTVAMRATGRYRKSDNYYYGGGDEAINSFHEDRDLSLRAGYNAGDRHRITVGASAHYGGPWGKAYGFNQKEQMFAQNEEDNLLHFAGKYEGDRVGVFDKLLVSCFYDRETREYHNMKMNSTLSRLYFEDVTDYKGVSFGGNVLAAVRAGINYFSFGADGYSVRLWSPVDTVDCYNYTQPTVTLEKDGAQGAGVASGGVFVQDVIRLGRQVSLTAGVRADRAEIFEGDVPGGQDEIREARKAISASAGLVYAPSAAHAFAINVGRAFRMPDAVDMFTEQVTCQGTLSPNPDLGPEYSVNFDAGYRGRMKGFAWDISAFLNQYSDLIVKKLNPEDTSESMMANEDYARIMGGEIELSYKQCDIFAKGCSVKAGCSASYCAGGSFDDADGQWDIASSGEPLSGIPPARIRPNVRVSYAAAEWKYFFEVELDNSLKKTRVPDELSEATWNNEDVGAYSLVNLSAGVALFNHACLEEIRFNVAVSNAFDTHYYPFGSHIPGKGRDIRMLLSFAY